MSPYLVVLAGGSGTRFWPRSRALRPKQLLNIVGEESLLVNTLRRFQGWIPADRTLIVTTEQLAGPIREAVGAFPGVELLCEPQARNTAPCIAMAMEAIRARDLNATAVIVPADHWIPDTTEYRRCMQLAVEAAQAKKALVTIGIPPTRPETGYGYIRSGGENGKGVYSVERFVEKPSKEVAETMVQHPEYLWNAGMFVWTANVFFQELKNSSPDLISQLKPYRDALERGEAGRAELRACYGGTQAISIDYALLEKSKNVLVVPGANFGWNDLGSFVSLDEIYDKAEGGVARAEKVLAVDSMANIVDCPGKTVALLGVTDMILVDVGDVLLLASRDRAQDVKKFVDRLKQEGRTDLI